MSKLVSESSTESIQFLVFSHSRCRKLYQGLWDETPVSYPRGSGYKNSTRRLDKLTEFLWFFSVSLGKCRYSRLCSSSSFIVTLSLIQRKACARAQFSGCSSTTNDHSETGQIAVCSQNLTLGALSSRSALSMLVGALFKKFGLFFLTRLVSQIKPRLSTFF